MRKFGMKEVFSDDWRQTVFWLAIALTALIVGFAFGWVWRDRPESLARIRIIEVLTAIGTVGAAVVALWLGLRQSLREVKAQEVKARGIAVVLTVKLDNACASLSRLRLAVNNARGTAANLRSQSMNDEDRKTEILRVVDNLKSDFQVLLKQCSEIAGYEEIEALAFAPYDLSHRLARKVTHAEYIQPSVDSYWWVFTASCLDASRGIAEHNVLEGALEKCEDLAKQYRTLAADLHIFSEMKLHS